MTSRQSGTRPAEKRTEAVLAAAEEWLRLRLTMANTSTGISLPEAEDHGPGDELVVVLQRVRELGDAVTIVEKLRRPVSEPIVTGAGSLSIALSIGVTMVRPGENPDAIITRAEHAMDRAKQSGRSQVVTFSDQTDSADDRSVARQSVL